MDTVTKNLLFLKDKGGSFGIYSCEIQIIGDKFFEIYLGDHITRQFFYENYLDKYPHVGQEVLVGETRCKVRVKIDPQKNIWRLKIQDPQ